MPPGATPCTISPIRPDARSPLPLVIGATLICSDEACAEAIDVVATLEELDHLVCHGCECTLTVLAVWEVEDPMAACSVVALRPRRVELPLAA